MECQINPNRGSGSKMMRCWCKTVMDHWCLRYAEKPKENFEDPQDVQAICEAQENIGDLKLKSAKDFTVPKHLRMNTERKIAEMIALEENVRTITQTQTYANTHLISFPALTSSRLFFFLFPVFS